MGFRTPTSRSAIPSSVQVTPNHSEPAFSRALATCGPPCPYAFPFTMDRILRGVLRFSFGGFTYFRIASRLYVRAPSETSAQTGLLTSFWGLFCLLGMCLQCSGGFTPPPKMPVYDIRASPADSHFGCRVKDNTPPHCKPQALLTAARRHTPTPSCDSSSSLFSIGSVPFNR